MSRLGFPAPCTGYAAAVRVLHNFGEGWHRVLQLPVFTLNGYIAFNLPRTVTALGASLLIGVLTTHCYLLIGLVAQPSLRMPAYFVVYVAVLTLGCLTAATAIALGRRPATTERGWRLGSAVCMAFLAVYLTTRFAALSGLVTLTGRWDLAPGSFAMACAAGFVAVHITVRSGINVAYPRRREWHD